MKKQNNWKVHCVCISHWVGCAVLILGLAVLPAPICAQPAYYPAPVYVVGPQPDLQYYLNSDLGLSLMPNFESSRFGSPGEFHLDDGVRFGLEPGYNFLTLGRFTLGGEFETGVTYNQISSVRMADSPTLRRGDYYQVPLLGNLVASFQADSFVAPYLGVGGGGDCSFARIHSPFYFGHSSDSDRVDPAVQAEAGVRFHLSPWGDAGVGYKFLAAFPGQGDDVYTHAVLASLTIRF